jgi:hypothetical protein
MRATSSGVNSGWTLEVNAGCERSCIASRGVYHESDVANTPSQGAHAFPPFARFLGRIRRGAETNVERLTVLVLVGSSRG